MRLHALAGFLLLLAPCALAQRQTWIVGPGGFPDLQAAFDAPQVVDGDLVVVRPGRWAGATLRKGLAVEADAGAILGSDDPLAPPDALRIEGLRRDQAATVRGFRIDNGLVDAVDCAGLVLVDDVDARQDPSDLFAPLALRARRCAWLVVVRSTALGRVALAEDSDVAFDECTLTSRDGYSLFGGTFPSGGPALVLTRCSAAMADTSANGARWLAGTGGCGSPGIAIEDSVVGINGYAVIRGGTSVSMLCAAPAIAFTGSGALVIDPNVTLVGVQAPPVQGITPIIRPVPALRAPDLVLGTRAIGSLQAQAGDAYAVVLGVAMPPVAVPALGGGLGLDPRGPLLAVAAGTTFSGQEAWSLPVPADPALAGGIVGLQAVAGAAAPNLSNPLVRALR